MTQAVGPAVLLITGQGGSGKSSLAECVATTLDWSRLGEDDYWVRRGWHGLRTPEQEELVQQEVLADLLGLISAGRRVVLEFILYKQPPNPLTAYQAALRRHLVTFETVVLRASVEAVLSRMERRGRATDLADLEARRPDVINQWMQTEEDYIDPRWLIDSTDLSLRKVCEIALARMS